MADLFDPDFGHVKRVCHAHPGNAKWRQDLSCRRFVLGVPVPGSRNAAVFGTLAQRDTRSRRT